MIEASNEKAASKGNLVNWEPGQSGNPAGTKPGTIQQRSLVKNLEKMLDIEINPDEFLSSEVAKRMRMLMPLASTTTIRDLISARLVAIALLSESKTAMRAIKEIHDRVEGQPTKTVKINQGPQYAVFEMLVENDTDEPDDEREIIDVTPTEAHDGEAQEITLEPDQNEDDPD